MSAFGQRHRVLPLCLWLLAFPTTTTLAAQPGATSPGDQELIRKRQDRLLDEQRRRLRDLQELPGKTPAAPPPITPPTDRCFQIHSIRLRGAEQVSATERQALLQPYVRQCLGVAHLNDLLKIITNHYIDRGLVTSRAYLPAQELSSGQLQIEVVEGRLEGLQGAPGSNLSHRELAMAFPGRTGEVLDLREIEQLVDQLNRLPSNRAHMELTPGTGIGSSTVKVSNTPQKPWRASLSRNNSGQKSTGEQQWGLGLDWDSPLGLADQLNLRGNHDAQSDSARGSDNATLNYNLPWGWWNFNYSYSQNHYQSVSRSAWGSFAYSGTSQSHQLQAERVIHRDSLSKTSVSSGIAHMRAENYIGTAKQANNSPRITEAQFGINHGRRLGGAFVNLDFGLQQGIGALDAQSGRDPRPGQPTSRYRKYTATASYLRPLQLFGEAVTFTSLATGQRSEDVLYSAQRMSTGGQSSVRGFKDHYLSGDSGGYWRNELRWTRSVAWAWLRPAFAEYGASLAYDMGVISNTRYAGDQHGRVSGNAIELFARSQHAALSLTFAHSLERPAAIADREAPIYLRMDFFL